MVRKLKEKITSKIVKAFRYLRQIKLIWVCERKLKNASCSHSNTLYIDSANSENLSTLLLFSNTFFAVEVS